MPIKPLLILVGLMILLDTITGLWKAKKAGEPITSQNLSRVISKMLLYQLGVITFYTLERFMLGEFVATFTSIQFFLTKVVAIFFCGIELMSINENIKCIFGLTLFGMFKKMLLRAKDVKKEITEINETE